MQVIVLAKPPAYATVSSALAEGVSLSRARDSRELEELLCQFRESMIAIEPQGGGLRSALGEEDQRICALFDQYPVTGVILLCRIRAPGGAMLMLRRLVKRQRIRIVLFDESDAETQMRLAVDELSRCELAVEVLDELTPVLSRLPGRLQFALRLAITDPHRFRQVDEVARAAQISRRTLDRQIRLAGMRSAEHLLSGALLLRMYEMMHVWGYPGAEVMRALAIPNRQRMWTLSLRVVGVTPSKLRALPPHFVTSRVVGWIVRGDGQTENGARITG